MKRPFRLGEADRHGTKAEKRLAKRLGAKLTPASGAAHHGAKGDLTTEKFRIESKATLADSYRVEYGDLRKIAQEATEQNQYPGFTFQFVTPTGRPRESGTWVCVPEHVFRELIGGSDG